MYITASADGEAVSFSDQTTSMCIKCYSWHNQWFEITYVWGTLWTPYSIHLTYVPKSLNQYVTTYLEQRGLLVKLQSLN